MKTSHEPDKIESMPADIQAFIKDAVMPLQLDKRLSGVAAGGSAVIRMMDEFSDLDLVIVVWSEYFK